MSGELDPARLQDPALQPIAEKVQAGERLSAADGLTLFETPDLLGLGALADSANRRRNGDRVFFSANQHINPDQRLHPAEDLRLLLLRPDAEGRGRVHPIAGGGVPRGGAGPRACRPASSTSSAGCIPSCG